MIARTITDHVLADLHHSLMRVLALVLAATLVVAPMVQSSVTIALVEECGSKPPPIIEEEVHKSIAPPGAALPDAPSRGTDLRAETGHGELPSPVRDVFSPPPDLC